MLLYYLGEPKELILGNDESSIMSHIVIEARLGHIVEAEGGELELMLNNVLRTFHVLTPRERLYSALLSALNFDYGFSPSMDAPISTFLLLPLLNALIPLAVSFIVYLLLGRFIKVNRHFAFLILSLVLLGVAVLTYYLVPTFIYLSYLLFLGGTSLLLLYLKPKSNLRASLGFTLAQIPFYFLLALGASNRTDSLYTLFLRGISQGDNHLYSVISFFLFAPLLALLIALALSALRGHKKGDKGIEAARIPN